MQIAPTGVPARAFAGVVVGDAIVFDGARAAAFAADGRGTPACESAITRPRSPSTCGEAVHGGWVFAGAEGGDEHERF